MLCKNWGLKISAAELASVITVTPVANTQLIQVDVVGADPARAAQIANTLVEVFSQQIRDTQTQRYAASKQSLQTQMSDLESQIQGYKDQLAKGPSLVDRARLEDKISQYRTILQPTGLELRKHTPHRSPDDLVCRAGRAGYRPYCSYQSQYQAKHAPGSPNGSLAGHLRRLRVRIP